MLDEFREESLVDKVGGRFKLSALIQKRMVALNRGARPLVELKTNNHMETVIQEILNDKIYLDNTGNVAVADDGPGVPPGSEVAVFERFYRERPKSEKFGAHSGLGLSISKQIVAAHDGEIWAENRRTPDGAILGARFVVQFPQAK